jgi:hypothetical protein
LRLTKTFLPAVTVCLCLGPTARATDLGRSTKATLFNTSDRILKITILGAVPLPAPGADPSDPRNTPAASGPPFVAPTFDFTATVHRDGSSVQAAQWDPRRESAATWTLGGKSFTVPGNSAVTFEATSLDVYPLVQRLQMTIEDNAHPGMAPGTLFYGAYRFEAGAMLTQVLWGGIWATDMPPAQGLAGRRPPNTFDAEITKLGAAPSIGTTETKAAAPVANLLPEPPDGQWEKLMALDPALVRQLRKDLASLFKEMDGFSSSSSSPATAGLLPEPAHR